MDANELLNKPPDVTRSTVQKAIVVIADSPQFFGQLREKLSMVTGAWFVQKDFTDMDILKVEISREPSKELAGYGGRSISRSAGSMLDEWCFWLTVLGLSLRELIHEYRHQTLVLFKCCLLQPKVIRLR